MRRRRVMSMHKIVVKGVALLAMVGVFVVLSGSVGAVTLEGLQSPEGVKPIAPRAEPGASLTVQLIDPEKKLQEQTATVEVKVGGIQLVDPGKVHEQPQEGQGHLHYQVDSGPVIATTTTKLSFHDLSAGTHKITIMLVGNDHQALGPRETLTVDVPTMNGDRAQR
jgi:hypothetical protein